VVSFSFLLMYLGTRESWPGDYLLGVAFGIVGVVACLVLTFLPSRRRARPAPLEEPA
jgi:UDP-GlcNAc:undecaprenyl-phosphate GlcNAc-1-phosphate transferase